MKQDYSGRHCDGIYVPHNTRDDYSFYYTLQGIKTRIIYSNNVNNPTDSSISLTPKESHKKRVTKLKECLIDKLDCLNVLFEAGCDDDKAKKAWKQFFNHDFWKVEQLEKSASYTESAHRSYVYPEAYSLDIRYELFDQNKMRHLTYKRTRRNQQLTPKNCTLCFEAIHTVPAPYEILWEVQNSGDEAIEANHLYHSKKYNYTEGNYNWESTAYKGTHTMTASISKNGTTVIKKTVEIRIV